MTRPAPRPKPPRAEVPIGTIMVIVLFTLAGVLTWLMLDGRLPR